MTSVEWRPIDTAPKDYSTILLAGCDYIVVGYWSERFEKFFDSWGEHEIEGPTHWARLPEPPEEEQ